MTKRVAGIGLMIVGLLAGVLALLMVLGTLLEFSRPGALYAGAFGLASGASLWAGVRLRRQL